MHDHHDGEMIGLWARREANKLYNIMVDFWMSLCPSLYEGDCTKMFSD